MIFPPPRASAPRRAAIRAYLAPAAGWLGVLLSLSASESLWAQQSSTDSGARPQFHAAQVPSSSATADTGTSGRPQFHASQVTASGSTATAAGAAQPRFQTGRLPPILDPPAENGYGDAAAGFTPTRGLSALPPNSFQQQPPIITPASLFRNTQFPYGPIVATPGVGPEVHSESLTGEFKLNLPALNGGIPFLQRGFEPQDADLKLGPLFFKLRAAEAAILHSDNINLTPERESGTVAYLAMTVDIVAQITETLRLATAGTFVYLPIEGKAGIAGYGLSDFYDFGLLAGPLAHAQVAWDTQIGGWNVVFMDDFQAYEGVFSNDFRSDDALFDGYNVNDQSQAGRYILRPDQGNIFQNTGSNDNNRLGFRNNLVVFSNTVSAQADRLLPGTIRLQARVYHENLWYNQGNRGQMPLRVDDAMVGLYDERENLRFKPYLTYEAYSNNEFTGVQNIIRAGIHGPITNQLDMRAEGGYFWGGLQGDGALWLFELDHTAGPYTRESLLAGRNFTAFHDEIDDYIGYLIQQVLGPKLDADAYIYRLRIEDSFSDGSTFTDNQWRLGLRMTYNMGPKTTLRVVGEYDKFDQDHTTGWTGRAELGYNFTDTLLLHLIYQYQQSQSDTESRNYRENLVFLSLTKFFR